MRRQHVDQPALKRVALVFALLLFACAEEPPVLGSLIDHELWSFGASPSDPWNEHAPEVVVCPEASFGVEGEGVDRYLEVDSGGCRYMSATQPAQIEICEGCTVEIVAWHLGLADIVPGEAHFGIGLNGEAVFEETLPIPSEAKSWNERVVIPEFVPAQSPVVFHLHNHGTNSWRLLRISVVEGP